MRKRTIVSEKNEYHNGRRIQTRIIEEICELSDDFAALGDVYQNIASRQSSIEALKIDMERYPENKPGDISEISRLSIEMNELSTEVDRYMNYIKGYAAPEEGK